MRLSLAPGVHGALVDGDLVLLDIEADTYFCLPAGEHALALRGDGLDAEPPDLARALCEAGLASAAAEADPAVPACPLIAPPRRTARAVLEAAPELRRAGARARHLLALARALVTAGRASGRTFADRLDARGGAGAEVTPGLLADLAVYRRILPWLPVDGACLFRSEMLRAYLRALGHEATWTFGVRTWPFRAHCWLQVGDLALDDEAERLAAYHPILAV